MSDVLHQAEDPYLVWGVRLQEDYGGQGDTGAGACILNAEQKYLCVCVCE